MKPITAKALEYMRPLLFFGFLFLFAHESRGQKIVKRKDFFQQQTVVEATLTTDFGKMIEAKDEPAYQPGHLTWHNTDTAGEVSEDIRVKLRGNFRRKQCSFASMMFDFDLKEKESSLSNLKEVKVVVPCEWGSQDEQWVFREYLVYKLYALFTDMSFRVRLVHFNFNDTSGYFKPYKQYGFMLEDVDDLAKRNDAKEVKEEERIGWQATERLNTTLVSIFQYMIGNSDWSIPPRHNIKMIREKGSDTAQPYVVPYDFDYCGAVNALYAEPAPNLRIEKVTERLYFGPPRTKEEVTAVLEQFRKNESAVFATLENFALLKEAGKTEMKAYLREFYDMISNGKVPALFMEGGKRP